MESEREGKKTLASSNMAFFFFFLNKPRCVFFLKTAELQSLQMPFQKERLILIIRRPFLSVLFCFVVVFSISVVEEE